MENKCILNDESRKVISEEIKLWIIETDEFRNEIKEIFSELRKSN